MNRGTKSRPLDNESGIVPSRRLLIPGTAPPAQAASLPRLALVSFLTIMSRFSFDK